jgi:hypothetical protein
MSLAELKNQSAALTPGEQRELAAFLAVLRMKQSGEWDGASDSEAAPEHQAWITLEDAKRKLMENP